MKYSLTGVFWVSSGASYLSDMLINSQWIGLQLTTYIKKKKLISTTQSFGEYPKIKTIANNWMMVNQKVYHNTYNMTEASK